MRSAAHRAVDPYELLLDGGHGDDALSHVMAAATAPGTHSELLGLAVAHSAFLAEQATTAAPARAPARHRPAATRTVAGRLLAAKAVAAVSGITLIGGVAYAATTTSLFRSPASDHPPAQQSTQPGVTGNGQSTTTQLNGGNGPATAVPARPNASKSVSPRRNAYGHTAGRPSGAHGTPHNPPNPGHLPGVGNSSASSTAPQQVNTPDPKKSHPVHPTQANGPRPH
jgi:hypothetical protein